MDDLVEVDVEVEHVGSNAILITTGDNEDLWIPLSQIEGCYEEFLPGRSYTIEIPEWLAIEKGLV